MLVSSSIPTIAQIIYAINNPRPANFSVGTANVEAVAGSFSTVSSSSLGSASDVSLSTYA
jgi:hypothetical protein